MKVALNLLGHVYSLTGASQQVTRYFAVTSPLVLSTRVLALLLTVLKKIALTAIVDQTYNPD